MLVIGFLLLVGLARRARDGSRTAQVTLAWTRQGPSRGCLHRPRARWPTRSAGSLRPRPAADPDARRSAHRCSAYFVRDGRAAPLLAPKDHVDRLRRHDPRWSLDPPAWSTRAPATPPPAPCLLGGDAGRRPALLVFLPRLSRHPGRRSRSSSRGRGARSADGAASTRIHVTSSEVMRAADQRRLSPVARARVARCSRATRSDSLPAPSPVGAVRTADSRPARPRCHERQAQPYRSPPGTHSTSPCSRFAWRARMNSRSESRFR